MKSTKSTFTENFYLKLIGIILSAVLLFGLCKLIPPTTIAAIVSSIISLVLGYFFGKGNRNIV